MIIRFFLLLAIALGLSACSSYRPAGDAFHKSLIGPYQLDSGDRVRVIVYDQENLNNEYTVDQSGYISVPLIGDVTARGRHTTELAAEIATRLQNGFVRDPDVSVEIAQYRPFFIMGEVTNAGQYAYVTGMTVQTAIAISGGFTPRAKQRYVDITRQINGKIITGRVSLTDPVRPGDTIYVRERLF
ncbi:polysaccharide biosynthesis/export family protein [Cohaesibacter gelatinilyticus]|uniref:Polysaccharide export outer membrane protein n=1 Tax=Cohaesibacter gelatinilyticus TaxID=372072 RepID=A0A285ND60_9HYPH|nr:polysaccharide biosynthesis/export family protein [Cohaesibacter gelatinilyticus]SNZ07369.1 polysaccharide export outer membrane protein [Cohaesibacter gelatinilyticus]HAT88036.1 polysaccharide export protein [Hyphomicrobiales bacterium]